MHLTDTAGTRSFVLPLLVGAGALAFLLLTGDSLLQDSDSFWQIETGRWILAHGTVPTVDSFSFTRAGAPWQSSSWLAQVIFALAMQAGWAGPVIVTALAVATALAQFAAYLQRFAPALVTAALALAAMVLIMPHVLARPHMLALPVMVAWFIGLIDAADRKAPPPWALLTVMVLWANLHGGFVFGLMLIGALGVEALRHAEPQRRVPLALRWAAFGIAAVAACCATPYGWGTLLAATKILSLGDVLSTLGEWASSDFSKFGAFEASLLALLGIAMARGLTLPWPRLLLVLGLVHMALAHVRSIEHYALLVPMIAARPWALQFGLGRASAEAKPDLAPPAWAGVVAVIAIIAATIAAAPRLHYRFDEAQVPERALAAAQVHGARRIFNAYIFGGYLISRHVPVFIDGRAELYGEARVMDTLRATAGRDPAALDRLLSGNDIDATLLPPSAGAVREMDQRPGWRRLYADDIAVVHVRGGH
ncbi:hypothetical protein BJ123_11060 [Rhodopseudomonas thermotolerans]|uniref:4-amino-4-deoxy-L-arabinose transferase-like glycosyltransferase n=3 Tax=Nitrobacteraceae TaxID=41294 RepID=A0A336JQZ7_9BRAD|nr:hypothetical protein BJ125_11060 [Rhodopseudomonas pentothenatexigens]REG02620.1 hypothetical protein BJ123_11060 [Rhodopseudomonas thermotolerans]SSW91093.1 hypothetical protein SAMN05892882_11060 [Rhodopseudomonas pentothenatexigens]